MHLRYLFVFTVIVTVVALSGAPSIADEGDLDSWARRLASDRASERGAAMRDLRRLEAEDVDVLHQLARHGDVNVRVAATDVLTRWVQGDDVPRRSAARTALAQLAERRDRAGPFAASRLESIERDAERAVLAALSEPANPVPLFT